MSTVSDPERIRIRRAAEITGMPVRTLQQLAPHIPGSAKLGERWTFNLIALRAWVREREVATKQKAAAEIRAGWRKASTSAAASGGAGSRSMAEFTDEAYARAIGLRR